MSTANIINENLEKMNQVEKSFDVIIVCTSTEPQAEYWQGRLTMSRGAVSKSDAVIVAVHEDWEGGAGNGLGTLYAYEKASKKALELFGLDITAKLLEGKTSVAMFHTAGKGTRLAPLPGSENNNKPGVKLPSVLNVDGRQLPMTILEAVIKQTGVYAVSRKGRLSVFWGDQVFIPSNTVEYEAKHLVDILASCRPMPSAQQWEDEGLEKYGLIAVNELGNAAQVDKVTHASATKLLSSFGSLKTVGTSLGSFSVDVSLLVEMLKEFSAELSSKVGKLDADPHFWMPMTLTAESYVELMCQKGVDAETSAEHFNRIGKMMDRIGKEVPVFGCVDVGTSCYWWDYGQAKLYMKNNLLLTQANEESAALRKFLGLENDFQNSKFGNTVEVEGNSVILNSVVSVVKSKASVLSNVNANAVNVESSLLMNVSARSITGKNCLVYNIADDSEEGLVLEDGAILVGIFLPGGKKMVMRSKFSLDGGVYWKEIVENNSHSFEGIYKMNAEVDVRVVEVEMLAEMDRIKSLLVGAVHLKPEPETVQVEKAKVVTPINAITTA